MLMSGRRVKLQEHMLYEILQTFRTVHTCDKWDIYTINEVNYTISCSLMICEI